MQAVKGRDTSIERILSSALHRRGLRFRRCVATLPGKPDFVFPKAKLVVFVDGDFWHGWRFPVWEAKLQPYWRQKIAKNRRRDRHNFRRLRRNGWTVLRFWSHQLDRGIDEIIDRIETALYAANTANPIRAADDAGKPFRQRRLKA